MLKHRARRATQQSAKSGPPRSGRLGKPAGRRRNACPGADGPALRAAPSQRASQGDHEGFGGAEHGLCRMAQLTEEGKASAPRVA